MSVNYGGTHTHTHTHTAPPPPPTNLTVQSLSSCRVRLSWTPPPNTVPLNTLRPQHFLIEAQVGGGVWESVDGAVPLGDTSLTVSKSMAYMQYIIRVCVYVV